MAATDTTTSESITNNNFLSQKTSDTRRTSSSGLRFFSDTGSSTSKAFDRGVKTLQRDNASRAQQAWRDVKNATENDDDEVVEYDYFRAEMAYRLVDRLDDIKREEGFPLALDLGEFATVVWYFHHPDVLNDASTQQLTLLTLRFWTRICTQGYLL